MKYDYLIVGAGLFSAVFVHQMAQKGKKCIVIDRRDHIAGNCYNEVVEGIDVHKYGAHIFHTSNKKVWEYVNSFTDFNNFVNSPIADFNGETYNLPFNMNTFAKMWGIKTPQQARDIINKQVEESGITAPKNLEEKAITLVGKDIYEKLICGYTEKQWGKKCSELPEFIINRLPLRFTYDNNYFNDRYQGIPIDGYTNMIVKMFGDTEILLGVEFKEYIKENPNIAEKILYTGSVDELCDYKFGELEYRSLKFETKILDEDNFQGNAVVNYTDAVTPYTRIIEHKHFNNKNQEKTVITYEYPADWSKGLDAYYPINNDENSTKYQKYVEHINSSMPNVILGGRLGLYSYFDMDKVIEKAFEICESL